MPVINYQPETLEETTKKAKAFANKTESVVIVYRDYDFDFPVYSYCTDKVFWSMFDNFEVDKNWIEVVVNPD